jgi:N-acetylglucosaminyldiphosphoundecaprenol N-acetyl-beta-D-mannosaminyltransferase
MKVNVAGVEIDNVNAREAIEKIDGFVKSGTAHYVVTPYSELIVFALNNPQYKNILNQASLALPDGIGILWAAKFLSLPITPYPIASHIEAFVQVILTGIAIIFEPRYIRSVIRERVTGSRLIYDIAKLAEEKNYSLSLIGGSGNVAAQSAYELKKLYPNLNIKLALSDRSFDDQICREIKESNSDILLIAYSPPRQETWLNQNLSQLNVKVAMGLGGTFDYVAGKHPVAPNFAHAMGLEWLWRLVTQPSRWKRMWNAIPVFIWKIFLFKLKSKNHERN